MLQEVENGCALPPRQRYQTDLAREGFREDPAQRRVVEQLQALHETLLQQDGPVPWWRRFWPRARPVRGLYLWGGPGRGKTYLMDCFFGGLPLGNKRRVHFHRFMLEVHGALDALPKTPDPLDIVATQMAQRHPVLCLDEFHVNDVADAMLLSGLLEGLFRRGVVMVATSNTPPDELYRDGLQRERFLPAIELLNRCLAVTDLGDGTDYRLEHLETSGTYRIMVEGPEADAWLQARMGELVPGQPLVETAVEVAGRTLQARASAEDVIWFRFAELCERPRSSRDFLELAREFHTLLLQGVPGLGDEQDEAARRFVHLVDALYDHGVKLVVTAAAAPTDLYSGSRLKTMFERTASRLTEMSGTGYLARAHRTD